jgi:internalin A
MIAATHCAADRDPDLDYPHLAREFPGMVAGHFEVDSQTGRGIAELRAAIAAEASRLPQMGQKISRPWAAIREEIAELSTDQPQMSFQDYAAFVRAPPAAERGSRHARRADARPGTDHLLRRG